MPDDTPNLPAPEPQAPPPAPPASVPPEPPASLPASLPPPPAPVRPPSAADVRARRPDYRGEELDPERGPGLGCFWFQVIVLGFFIVLIPIGINLAWPYELLAILLFVVIGLLLFTGQTVIFLLRLVAADRRAQGRRRPLASSTKTVGELEEEHRVAHAVGGARPVAAERPEAVAATPEADEPGPADAERGSEAMIRDWEVPPEPVADARGIKSELEPGADTDVTRSNAGPGAPARTLDGRTALAGGAAGDHEVTPAGRLHESSPVRQRQGPAADVPDAAPAEEKPADTAPPPDTASAGPGEPPEEPDPGVPQ